MHLPNFFNTLFRHINFKDTKVCVFVAFLSACLCVYALSYDIIVRVYICVNGGGI